MKPLVKIRKANEHGLYETNRYYTIGPHPAFGDEEPYRKVVNYYNQYKKWHGWDYISGAKKTYIIDEHYQFNDKLDGLLEDS